MHHGELGKIRATEIRAESVPEMKEYVHIAKVKNEWWRLFAFQGTDMVVCDVNNKGQMKRVDMLYISTHGSGNPGDANAWCGHFDYLHIVNDAEVADENKELNIETNVPEPKETMAAAGSMGMDVATEHLRNISMFAKSADEAGRASDVLVPSATKAAEGSIGIDASKIQPRMIKIMVKSEDETGTVSVAYKIGIHEPLQILMGKWCVEQDFKPEDVEFFHPSGSNHLILTPDDTPHNLGWEGDSSICAQPVVGSTIAQSPRASKEKVQKKRKRIVVKSTAEADIASDVAMEPTRAPKKKVQQRQKRAKACGVFSRLARLESQVAKLEKDKHNLEKELQELKKSSVSRGARSHESNEDAGDHDNRGAPRKLQDLPKKPATGYMMFCAHFRTTAEYKALASEAIVSESARSTEPDAGKSSQKGGKLKKLTTALSIAWNALPEHERATWVKNGNEARKSYAVASKQIVGGTVRQ